MNTITQQIKDFRESFFDKQERPNKPDGRPIFAYKISNEEYQALSAMLESIHAQNAKLHNIEPWLFLYAVETWRRKYDGSTRTWDYIVLGDQNFSNEPLKDIRNDVVSKGCKYWGLAKHPSRKYYINTVAYHAGISVQQLDNNYFRSSCERVIASNDDDLGTAIEREFHNIIQLFDKDLLVDLFDKIIDLNSYHNLADKQDPIKYLDSVDPKWTYDLPIHLEQEEATQLIKMLFHKAKHRSTTKHSDFIEIRHMLRVDQNTDGYDDLYQVKLPEILPKEISDRLNKSNRYKLTYKGKELASYVWSEQQQSYRREAASKLTVALSDLTFYIGTILNKFEFPQQRIQTTGYQADHGSVIYYRDHKEGFIADSEGAPKTSADGKYFVRIGEQVQIDGERIEEIDADYRLYEVKGAHCITIDGQTHDVEVLSPQQIYDANQALQKLGVDYRDEINDETLLLRSDVQHIMRINSHILKAKDKGALKRNGKQDCHFGQFIWQYGLVRRKIWLLPGNFDIIADPKTQQIKLTRNPFIDYEMICDQQTIPPMESGGDYVCFDLSNTKAQTVDLNILFKDNQTLSCQLDQPFESLRLFHSGVMQTDIAHQSYSLSDLKKMTVKGRVAALKISIQTSSGDIIPIERTSFERKTSLDIDISGYIDILDGAFALSEGLDDHLSLQFSSSQSELLSIKIRQYQYQGDDPQQSNYRDYLAIEGKLKAVSLLDMSEHTIDAEDHGDILKNNLWLIMPEQNYHHYRPHRIDLLDKDTKHLDHALKAAIISANDDEQSIYHFMQDIYDSLQNNQSLTLDSNKKLHQLKHYLEGYFIHLPKYPLTTLRVFRCLQQFPLLLFMLEHVGARIEYKRIIDQLSILLDFMPKQDWDLIEKICSSELALLEMTQIGIRKSHQRQMKLDWENHRRLNGNQDDFSKVAAILVGDRVSQIFNCPGAMCCLDTLPSLELKVLGLSSEKVIEVAPVVLDLFTGYILQKDEVIKASQNAQTIWLYSGRKSAYYFATKKDFEEKVKSVVIFKGLGKELDEPRQNAFAFSLNLYAFNLIRDFLEAQANDPTSKAMQKLHQHVAAELDKINNLSRDQFKVIEDEIHFIQDEFYLIDKKEIKSLWCKYLALIAANIYVGHIQYKQAWHALSPIHYLIKEALAESIEYIDCHQRYIKNLSRNLVK